MKNLPGKLIGLCGLSGSGKTKTCQSLIKLLRDSEVDCSGFISPAVFDNDTKRSIDVLWIKSGERRELLTQVKETSQQFIGRWEINSQAFEWVEQKLNQFEYCQVFFCDEIGPLEIEQGKGWVKALEILREGNFGLGVVTFRPSLEGYFWHHFSDMVLFHLNSEGDANDAIDRVISILDIS